MREKPILFSTPMVQALLDDTKNQTRRTNGLEFINENPDRWLSASIVSGEDDKILAAFRGKVNPLIVASAVECPFGKEGDRLWVRETWQNGGWDGTTTVSPAYKAAGHAHLCGGWRPSIHMPREISRVLLEITDVRIDRLQNISAADAIGEGIKAHESWPEAPDVPRYQLYGPLYEKSADKLGYETISDPVFSFFTLWISIHGDDAVKKNPWVWVVNFKRL
ncbi:hypothetical protein LZD49_12530 [Dyadobacter sp. CY261]|uniref:hypothetical protein n=1 Tax=Dyadobacter sp. CY261 TaxID=2907203 RepID=UPI001F444AF5|nr:hypothetical protein [Dyadobacter sp. CY261]MCF0071299.1 hypothetical protein [Dyadobacter sp. CY261]